MRMQSLTPEKYKKKRKKIGTQEKAAKLLGVTKATISNRERNTKNITLEASYALDYVLIQSEAGIN